jgi:hypothetical protein
MKGVPKETVILIAIILLVFALLYFAWTKGLLPFGLGITEAECHTEVMRECSEFQSRQDTNRLSTTLKKCWGYIAKLPTVNPKGDCVSCKDNPGTTEAPSYCSNCCAQELAGWTK